MPPDPYDWQKEHGLGGEIFPLGHLLRELRGELDECDCEKCRPVSIDDVIEDEDDAISIDDDALLIDIDDVVVTDEELEIALINNEVAEGDLVSLDHECRNWCFKLNLLTWDVDVPERLGQEAELWLITQD